MGRLLGSGGQSQVWSGIDSRTGGPVAIKILRLGPEQADAARREAALLARIDDPHVVRLLRMESTADDQLALVVEHAPGGNLAALVAARGTLDPGEVVTVLTPLATALAHLHGRGMVHGDLSPANVLFTATGRPLLADLGVSGLLGVDRVAHATPGFSDPSLVAGAALAPSSDVFSLGALAWFALTGRAPEPAGERPPLLPIAPTTPRDLAALVERCLHTQPQQRPSAAEVAMAAYATVDAAPVRLVPTDPHAEPCEIVTHRLRRDAVAAPAPVPAGRGRRPGRIASVLVGVGLVAALAAAAFFGWLPGRDSRGDAAGPTRSEPAASVPAPAPAPSTAAPTAKVVAAAAERGQDPATAVVALSQLRAQAFATGTTAPLHQANVAGSAALQDDLDTLGQLDSRQVVLRGLAFDVRSTQVLTSSQYEAQVRVTIVSGAHEVVRRADGAVLSSVQADIPTTVEVSMRRVQGRWQVLAVE